DFGFKDAFNLTYSSKGVLGTWFSDGYLAIDQGPIIVMIENYRSQLLWNKFMANPEIQSALTAVGFVSDSTTDVSDPDRLNYSFKLDGNYPNPFNPITRIRFELPATQNIKVDIYNVLGENVRELFNGELTAGINELIWNGNNDYGNSVPSGVYIYRMESNGNLLSSKMILQK
ncbi:MAG TPA: glucoamylase family protein, partial [Ignavibacteriaceae bacterium]